MFTQPVDIDVDASSASAPDYIGAARRDPDGKGLRIALARKVTMNSMAAAERLFVDLLPDTWSGLPPGLPREVIEDLARRARDAEKKVRQQRAESQQAKTTPIRVRVASQPTFTRYIFELPRLIGVVANNGKDRLTLTFDALLEFDLADAKATLPRMVGGIDSELDQDTAVVRFMFAEEVDVRTFREDISYVVDVGVDRTPKSRSADAVVRLDELPRIWRQSFAREQGCRPHRELPPAPRAHGPRARRRARAPLRTSAAAPAPPQTSALATGRHADDAGAVTPTAASAGSSTPCLPRPVPPSAAGRRRRRPAVCRHAIPARPLRTPPRRQRSRSRPRLRPRGAAAQPATCGTPADSRCRSRSPLEARRATISAC